MAVDSFLHDKSGISAITSELTNYLDEYNNHISELEQLISTMNSSTDWEDKTIKTSFIATASSYIKAYKSLALGIEAYINCLNKKSDNLSEHESLYS
jgi:hypothetical protein